MKRIDIGALTLLVLIVAGGLVRAPKQAIAQEQDIGKSLPDPPSNANMVVRNDHPDHLGFYVVGFGGGQATFLEARRLGNTFSNGIVDVSPMFRGKAIKFLGDMTEFISVYGVNETGEPDYSSRVVSATAKANGTLLSSMGVVTLNDLGIVKNAQLKSGWVNINTFKISGANRRL